MRVDSTNLRRPGPAPRPLDSSGLEAALSERIQGEVRFDKGSRALYATDSSNYRQVPIGVVLPRSVEDVLETLAVARRFGAPVLSRGGGTSLAGQCCNVAVVLDMSKYLNRVLDLDPGSRRARVEPGTILDTLRVRAERHQLTFGPDPASHDRCTLGGMIGNDSCGVHSVLAAFEGEGPRTADNVEELDLVTYDGVRMRVGRTPPEELDRIVREGGRRGQIYAGLKSLADKYGDEIRKRFPKIPRRVSGYNLPDLLPEKGFHVARALVGSEGTCVTVLEATVNLIPSPPARALLVMGFEDVFLAAEHVAQVLEHRPSALEGLDIGLISDMRKVGLHSDGDGIDLLPAGQGWLLVEFGAPTRPQAEEKARGLMARMTMSGHAPAMSLFGDAEEQRKIWRVRESGLGATAHVPGSKLTWEGWEDSAVAPEKLGGYLRDLRRLLNKHEYRGDFYGHFGQGCVHTRIDFDLESGAGVERFRAFLYEAADLVVSYGGSLSGEHGDGQARAELLPKMFGSEIVEAFRQFKRLWDPEGMMNPGKVVDAYSAVENLRLGAESSAKRSPTHFGYPDDDGDFSRATLRCVGVGKCRRLAGGTMCPSFMVTREEKHSTRGRARLLFEMLQSDVLEGGWREESVKEALDLCLACKACKSDCPTNVDMATYKAEFLSHYYARRLRPRSAYAFGLVAWWARIASLSPGFANFFTQTPILAAICRTATGMDRRRSIPAFTGETFRDWFRSRDRPDEVQVDRKTVLLFPDTFNNFFQPGTARAAVEVLEAAGFHVEIPDRPLCCGRPLYDSGMLGLARRTLVRILRSLRAEIRRGTPIVVLEPSCATVFRDELVNLFPADPDAARLREQTFVLSEFLRRKAPGFSTPKLSRKAIVQAHCHHDSILKMDDEKAVLADMGLDFTVLDSGCCGMAGSFGFESGEHCDVSIACGQRVLLPEVRRAGPETLVIADGFSCREQIRQETDRGALHLAQILQMAIHEGPAGPKGSIPETGYRESFPRRPSLTALTTAVAAVAAVAGATGALLRAGRREKR